VQVRARVAPVHIVLRPGDDRHRYQDAERDRNGVPLEFRDRLEAARGQPDLQTHHKQNDDDLQVRSTVVTELADESQNQIEHDPRVDRAPSGGDEPLDRGR